jgi:hypothetical protein
LREINMGRVHRVVESRILLGNLNANALYLERCIQEFGRGDEGGGEVKWRALYCTTLATNSTSFRKQGRIEFQEKRAAPL